MSSVGGTPIAKPPVVPAEAVPFALLVPEGELGVAAIELLVKADALLLAAGVAVVLAKLLAAP